MTTLTVTATEDYRDGSPPVAGTTDIVFSTSIGSTARFNSSQFGGSGISNTVAITGDGNANELTVHTPSDAFFSAAGWTFSAWSAVDLVRFFGTNDAETIVGSSQSNTMDGGGGADFLTGGNQNDSFTYSSSSDAVAGEILNGLGGTDAITIAGSGGVDLSLVTFVNIERLVAGGSATLDSDQIGAGAINELVGKGSSATVTIKGSSVDLESLTFTTWDVARHFILVNGTGGVDELTGSSQNDTMVGGLGADTISGGEGDDTFVYNASAELASGETIDGGGGTGDTLRVNVGQGFSLDVSGAGVLTGVEKAVFAQAGELRFSGENVGPAAGLINAVTGSAGANHLRTFDFNVDLSGVTFTNWTSGEDTIFFGGTAGDDTLIGSSQDDQFSYRPGGVDTLSGDGGNDVFSVSENAFVAGASINGGSGNADRISTAGADFSAGTIAGVERLTFFDVFTGTTVGITVSGAQVRASGIAIVDGGDKNDTLTVNGASVDLTGVTFNDWVAGVDRIVINGDAAADSALTGSTLVDVINAGGGNDTLTGAAGLDVLNGGLGNDTYVMDAENDTVIDTGGTDTVTSTISRSLADFASVENLTLLDAALTGTGNGLANVITGNGGANTLDGGDGTDVLLGGDGNDRLIGGLGADQFTGGTGADTFAFLVLADSGKKTSARDTILDFGADDFIDLSAIDARKGGKNNKFKFIGKDAFDGNKGELRYQKKNGDVIVSGDVNGDGKADFAILLDNLKKVAKSDFEL